MNEPTPVDQTDVTAASSDLDITVDVPADQYEVTPVGRFHKSCIHEVKEGELVEGNGDISLKGRVIRHYDPCKFKAFPTQGSDRVPAASGWVEDVWTSAPPNAFGFNWFNSLSGTAVVPAVPGQWGGQALFFFTALVNPSKPTIIQPVIQYGASAAGGSGYYWWIDVWYVDSNRNAHYASLQRVNSGDTISGILNAVPGTCSSAGVCKWEMIMLRNGVNTVSMQVQTNEAYTDAYKAVLEDYNVQHCSELEGANLFGPPPAKNITYSNVSLKVPGPTVNDFNDVTASVPWFGEGYPTTPQCSYSVSAPQPGSATLFF
jgi:hypothetical protein